MGLTRKLFIHSLFLSSMNTNTMVNVVTNVTTTVPSVPSVPSVTNVTTTLPTVLHPDTDANFLHIVSNTTDIYLEKGARSSLKVDFLHNQLKSILENDICHDRNWSVALEQNIPSINASGRKKCDIVVYDEHKKPAVIFPVKFIMSNYAQNKNNSWENLTGECCHLKWHPDNANLQIVPINIIFSTVPYLLANKTIQKFETIDYEKTFRIYDTLKHNNICHDVINYIVDVEPQNVVGDCYNQAPIITGFNEKTPFRTFRSILF